jgi:hypothetical protein
LNVCTPSFEDPSYVYQTASWCKQTKEVVYFFAAILKVLFCVGEARPDTMTIRDLIQNLDFQYHYFHLRSASVVVACFDVIGHHYIFE